MSNFQNIQSSANNILAEVVSLERNYHQMVERNATLLKSLATIKSNLERALKQPQSLNNAVYESIDIARSVTPYTNAGKLIFDPPLTEAEKNLPERN